MLDFVKEIKMCNKDLCSPGPGYRGDASLMKGECLGMSWPIEEGWGSSGKDSQKREPCIPVA